MDVQLYYYINGSWKEYNPKPASHDHTISEVEGLQAQLTSKLNLSGGTMTGPITMGSNNITGNNSSIFQAGRIIATNSNTRAHGITSKGSRANMLYLMDGVTGGLAASLLDVDVKNTTTPQKRIAKIGIYGSATSGTGGTPSAIYLWLSAVENNTYNVDATLKVDAQNRVGIAIAGSGRPTQALDVGGKIRMRTATVDSDDADTVVTKGYMLGKIVSDTNNYLTNVTGSGNGTVTFTRQGLVSLTWDATHSHPKSQITNFDNEVLALSPAGARPASDVKDWAKAPNKPTYNYSDIQGLTANKVLGRNTDDGPAELISTIQIPSWAMQANKPSYDLDQISDGTNHKKVTQSEKDTWNAKQNALGFTPEKAANKRTSIRLNADDTSYVSELGVKTYVDGLIGSVYRPAGDWNAATNSPTLVNNTPANSGKVYRVSVAGTQFGFTFAVGDKLAFNASGVISKWDNVDDVVSVNGQTGKVVLTTDNVDQGSNLYVSQNEKNTWNAKANDNQVVKTSGDQTISGEKIFNNGITIPGRTSYIDIGKKTNWFWTRFSGENWTFNNTYTGGGWARNLMEMKDAEGNAYFRIGAQGSGQSFTQMYIGPTYSNYWLSLNSTSALFKTKPQYGSDPTDNNDLTRKYYVDTKLATKQEKLTLNSGQVLGRTLSGSGSPEAVDTINISQIKVSDLDESNLYTTNTELTSGLAGKADKIHAHTTADITALTGLPTTATGSISTADTLNTALRKLQTQINSKTSNTGTVTQVKLGSTSYNPASGVISLPAYPTVPTYTSSTSITLSGNTFQRAALTGDVTASANSNTTTIKDNAVTTNKINNNAVTLAKMQNISTGKVLGRTTSGTGVVQELDMVDINALDLGAGTGWTEVWSGSVNLWSYRSSYYSATVPSNSYLGKRIAIEVQYGTGTTYTSKIIFGVLGSNSTTAASTSISRGIGWSYFDGTNLRVKTLYAYTSTSNTTTISVGHLKTLFGSFTGTTIEWSTAHDETLYMRNIWVIE